MGADRRVNVGSGEKQGVRLGQEVKAEGRDRRVKGGYVVGWGGSEEREEGCLVRQGNLGWEE